MLEVFVKHSVISTFPLKVIFQHKQTYFLCQALRAYSIHIFCSLMTLVHKSCAIYPSQLRITFDH